MQYILKSKNQRGRILFHPGGAEICNYAITDVQAIYLIFLHDTSSVCDNCTLHKYTKLTHDIEYDFQTLTMTAQIRQFIDLMIGYLDKKITCKHLNKLKKEELFIIFTYNYTPKQLSEFFFPAIACNHSFRNKLLKEINNDISINEIARKLNMTQRTFSRKFMEEFGEPARYWLLKQKAQSIRLKLLVPGTTISDIMQEYKFTDMSHFTKFCKEHYGCPPSELLRKIRENKIVK